jgi:parvulin-like peptidyl-prolyl isomerase
MKQFKRPRLFAGLLLVCGLGLAAQEVIEEIIAVVNDDVITLTEYKKEYEIRAAQARGQMQGDELDKMLVQIKSGLLDAMVTDLLLLQMAKEKNLNVSEQLKMALDNIKKENSLETDEELKRAVRSQGMDYDVWLKQMEETIMKQSVVYSEVNRTLSLDEAQVIEYYKAHKDEYLLPAEFKVRAVYLMLALDGRTPEALAARKAEIVDKVKGGLDFVQAAETYSDAPLKETKGDLGNLVTGQIDKILEAALMPLKTGETSGWVQTKNGWYLLKVEERKDARVKSFDESKRAIEEKMTSALQDIKFKEFLQDIKKRSYIKILKPSPLGDKRP